MKADREQRDAYDEVAATGWHAVIDVAREPARMQGAVEALRSAGRYVFISTGNVYADASTLHQDETAALLDPDADPAHPGKAYGMGKVAGERSIEAASGPRTLIARAGLIGGPGDTSGRSTYWPWRFAHPPGQFWFPTLHTDRPNSSTYETSPGG